MNAPFEDASEPVVPHPAARAIPTGPGDPTALLPWMDDVDPAASLLVVNRSQVGDRTGRYQFLNVLDRVDDPAIREKVIAKFEKMTHQPLRDFIEQAPWDGKRDKEQARALISPERGKTEQTLAAMPPRDRALLDAQASDWAETILDVTGKNGANHDDNARKIFRVLGPRTPVQIEAIRAALRKITGREHSLYEELDRALSKGNEDEAVADLSGDPIGNAAVGLANAAGDSARTKEILRGLDPSQLAEVKRQDPGARWAEAVPDNGGRAEARELLAGDRRAAETARLVDLFRAPSDGLRCDGVAPDKQSRQNLDARKPEHVFAELERANPADVASVREAWNREAAATGGATWDQMIRDRFREHATAAQRIEALIRGDRALDKALALREGIRSNDQHEIESALANPDLRSADPAVRANAAREKQAIADKARQLDANEQRAIAMFTGADPATISGRSVEVQLAQHAQAAAVAKPDLSDPLAMVRHAAHRDEERARHADDAWAADDLWATGEVSPATAIHRADTAGKAALVSGFQTSSELEAADAVYRQRYGAEMLAAPDPGKYAAAALVQQQLGEHRPLDAIERADVERAMDRDAKIIDQVRRDGPRAERSREVELADEDELAEKQHSDGLAASEATIARLGGHIGTEEHAREKLAVHAAMAGPGTSQRDFDQMSANVDRGLAAQHEAKIEHGDTMAGMVATVGKLAALLAAQPELFALLDVGASAAAIGVKSAEEGDDYDATKDLRRLGVDAALDVATASTVGLTKLGSEAVKEASASRELAGAGETAEQAISTMPATALGGSQKTGDLEQLYRDAAVAQPMLAQVTHQVAESAGGRALVPEMLKDRARAIEKITVDYGGDASRITDLARSSVVVDELDQIPQVVDEVRSGCKVMSMKDRFASPINGYRDVLFTLEMPNGHITELQVQLQAILDVKNGRGHEIYEQLRSTAARVQLEGREATAMELNETTRLQHEMKQLYDDAFGSKLGGVNAGR